MELLPNGFFPPLFLSDRRLLFSEWSLPPRRNRYVVRCFCFLSWGFVLPPVADCLRRRRMGAGQTDLLLLEHDACFGTPSKKPLGWLCNLGHRLGFALLRWPLFVMALFYIFCVGSGRSFLILFWFSTLM